MNRHGAGPGVDALTDSLSRAPLACAQRSAVRCIAVLAAAWAVLGTGDSAQAAESDNSFEAYTDEELSAVAGDWESLTTEERRDYFIEVRRRMAEAGEKQADPPRLPQIVGERRFGRIIPQPDGSVLHIEGVVRYRGSGQGQGQGDGEGGGESTAKDASQTETPPDYGTGFEQRVEQAAGNAREQRPVTAPVVSVATGNGARQTEQSEVAAETDHPETTTDAHEAEE